MKMSTLDDLHDAARSLNIMSGNLSQSIDRLNERIKALNIGLEVWHAASNLLDSIGYAKVSDRWGICICANNDMRWHFSDAPRELRIQLAKDIPALLEEMRAQTDKTTTRVVEAIKIINGGSIE